MNTLRLTDVELVALQMLFDRENEISCESRANDDFYPNGRPQSKEEIILDKSHHLLLIHRRFHSLGQIASEVLPVQHLLI